MIRFSQNFLSHESVAINFRTILSFVKTSTRIYRKFEILQQCSSIAINNLLFEIDFFFELFIYFTWKILENLKKLMWNKKEKKENHMRKKRKSRDIFSNFQISFKLSNLTSFNKKYVDFEYRFQSIWIDDLNINDKKYLSWVQNASKLRNIRRQTFCEKRDNIILLIDFFQFNFFHFLFDHAINQYLIDQLVYEMISSYIQFFNKSTFFEKFLWWIQWSIAKIFNTFILITLKVWYYSTFDSRVQSIKLL